MKARRRAKRKGRIPPILLRQFTPGGEMVQQLCIPSAQTVPGRAIDVTIPSSPRTEARRTYTGVVHNWTGKKVDKLVIAGLDAELEEEEATTDDVTFKRVTHFSEKRLSFRSDNIPAGAYVKVTAHSDPSRSIVTWYRGSEAVGSTPRIPVKYGKHFFGGGSVREKSQADWMILPGVVGVDQEQIYTCMRPVGANDMHFESQDPIASAWATPPAEIEFRHVNRDSYPYKVDVTNIDGSTSVFLQRSSNMTIPVQFTWTKDGVIISGDIGG
jgi:hypothetical protein